MTIAVTSKNLFPIRLEKHKNPIKETKREAENKFEIEIKNVATELNSSTTLTNNRNDNNANDDGIDGNVDNRMNFNCNDDDIDGSRTDVHFKTVASAPVRRSRPKVFD